MMGPEVTGVVLPREEWREGEREGWREGWREERTKGRRGEEGGGEEGGRKVWHFHLANLRRILLV